MPERSLAAAMRDAIKKKQTGSVRDDDAGHVLLEAVKNSTTRMDQIVLRRIGINEKTVRNPK
ncbi:MAG: hypothetical protein JSW48_04580 [Betaproteobacteria bacterium]|jgi:hypothetical protein|nr:MAG: hypothetical protein JSW48_04580 [Betaproteobacteria bacterium]